MNDEQIIKQFNSYDENGDGKITLEGNIYYLKF
jgi:Ca2+-binding EF-hand superfamily protein